MPYKPAKPCKHPGCPRLTNGMYCGEHIKAHTRASAYERGYTSKWRRLSKLYLKSHPLCVGCKANDKLTAATVVDHITPHRGDQTLFWDKSNWQPMCKQCHDRKTGTHDSNPTYGY